MDRIQFSVIRAIAYPNSDRSQLIRINDILLYKLQKAKRNANERAPLSGSKEKKLNVCRNVKVNIPRNPYLKAQSGTKEVKVSIRLRSEP
ncbi:hypothetical protein TNCV_3733811 [Trichonephila clavipes]|nr:hypothetical protein TNCV_3733811 [Trichonephila clavipes]